MPSKNLVRACALASLMAAPAAFACSGQLHIELEQAGVYRLDQKAIAGAQPGLADCRAADLELTQAGKEVPIRVVAQGDTLAGGDHIEWIGEPLHGPESWYDAYSINNVYVLGAAPGARARLRDAQAGPSGGHAALERHLHLEQENQMIRLDQSQQKPGEEADVFQWAKLTHVDPKPFETRFDLPDLDARGAAATVKLTLNFRGLSALQPPTKFDGKRPDDHIVEVSVNGRVVATLGWNGRAEVRRDIEVPAAALKSHENMLSLRVPKRGVPWNESFTAIDVVMFNWIEARYPLAGSLDDGALPLQVRTGADAPIDLAYRGQGQPVLYGSDGVRRPGRALGNGRYAFAAAPAGVEQYPAIDGQLAAPRTLRAMLGAELQHPAEGYDYLVVSHRSLMDAVKPLVEFHRQRGLKVALLDVDAVYDQFNFGIAHPQAIRNLVSTAYRDWPTRPRFLLLVGDASYDIRHDTYNDANYAKWTNLELLYPNSFGTIASTGYTTQPKKLADRNLIPTWQYPSQEGQSASDNWFAAVNANDWHPVVAVGRFPVVEPAEVSAIVAKTIDYASKPQLGAWRRDVMFITDEIESYKQASDEIAGALSRDGFVADKVYASPQESENAAHQNAIRTGIDEGRLLVHFIGHGGRYIWRTGPPDLRKNNDLFTLDDVSKLQSTERLPMVLSMTCYSAPFDNPGEDSIGEKFLREPGKGAVAVFAASWRNSPLPAYSKSVITELLEPGATIGEAIVRAKRKSDDRTLVEMYNLLGDPALVLERPQDSARVARDSDRWNDRVLVDLGRGFAGGNVTVDWLDAKGRRLQAATYTTHDARFGLSVPPALKGQVDQVRIYAASPASGRDAVGGLDFSKVVAQKSWRTAVADWWHTTTRPGYTPPVRHPDTIAVDDFDGVVARTAVANGTPAGGGANGAGSR